MQLKWLISLMAKITVHWNTSEQSHYLHDSTPTSRHISNLKKKKDTSPVPNRREECVTTFLFLSSIFNSL
jgi:hypothetical protein